MKNPSQLNCWDGFFIFTNQAIKFQRFLKRKRNEEI